MKNTESGFIHIIILVIVALALLKYFLNWDVFDAAASDQGQSTIGYVRDLVDVIWSYIATPVTFIWEEIIMPIISFAWDSFLALIEQGREANGTRD